MPPPEPPEEPPASPSTKRQENDEEPGRRGYAPVRKERQLKDDGRYMIFYDLGGEGERD